MATDFDAAWRRLEQMRSARHRIAQTAKGHAKHEALAENHALGLLLSEVERLKAEVERLRGELMAEAGARLESDEVAEKAEAELALVKKDLDPNEPSLGQALAAERERAEMHFAQVQRLAGIRLGLDNRVERLEKALLRIAEGNLGPDSWQADYDAIKLLARLALRPAVPDPTPSEEACQCSDPPHGYVSEQPDLPLGHEFSWKGSFACRFCGNDESAHRPKEKP